MVVRLHTNQLPHTSSALDFLPAVGAVVRGAVHPPLFFAGPSDGQRKKPFAKAQSIVEKTVRCGFGRWGQANSRATKVAVTLCYPLATWLAGLVVFAWLAVESLFPGDHPVFFIARFTAYLTAAVIGATMLMFIALFGLGCGCVLYWLENNAEVRPVVRAVVRSVGTSLWLIVAYMWLGVLLTAGWHPIPIALDELAQTNAIRNRFEDNVAFLWMSRLRYAVLACFLALCVWRLSRIGNTDNRTANGAAVANGNGATATNAREFTAKPWNAALAVVCGASFVVAVVAGLGALTGAAPAP